MTETPFRILTLCTGNTCRSPFAERALQAMLTRMVVATGELSWANATETLSAGTRALAGQAATPEIERCAERYGLTLATHAARALDRDLLDGAGLVLAMTRDHRREAVSLLPRMSRAAFTLSEFARLAEDAALTRTLVPAPGVAAPAVLTALVVAAHARRGFALPPEQPEDDDIADPFGRGEAAYNEATARIIAEVARIESVLIAATGVARSGHQGDPALATRTAPTPRRGCAQ